MSKSYHNIMLYLKFGFVTFGEKHEVTKGTWRLVEIIFIALYLHPFILNCTVTFGGIILTG